ncbi:MAG: hypothetical protein MOGMAGMI_02163 [Candidatus Omnitrophica bacterium]|nr:hypothetical protein [Candidatus Omnitrophota bacterium]
MPRPLRIEYPGAFYHIFSRGNERKEIFFSDEDRLLFLTALDEACIRYKAKLHAYCLMPNHYHLLLETPQGHLSRLMKYLLGVYTIRFNRIHKRTGHLFQGRYKSYLVEKEEYFLELSRYIHLNPVKAAMTDYPESFEWSSLRTILGQPDPHAPKCLEIHSTLDYFDHDASAYLKFVYDGLKGRIKDPLKEARGPFLGGEEFIANYRDRADLDGRDFDGRLQTLRLPLDYTQEVLEHEPTSLQMYALWTLARRSQPEIAKLKGISVSAVSKSIARFEKKLNHDHALKLRYDELKRAMSNVKD